MLQKLSNPKYSHRRLTMTISKKDPAYNGGRKDVKHPSVPTGYIYIVFIQRPHAGRARAVNNIQSPTVGPGKDFQKKNDPWRFNSRNSEKTKEIL